MTFESFAKQFIDTMGYDAARMFDAQLVSILYDTYTNGGESFAVFMARYFVPPTRVSFYDIYKSGGAFLFDEVDTAK